MKVYAVIEGCDDGYYPDYMVVDNRVYLKEEDAKKRLEELVEKDSYPIYEILSFEVKE